MSSETKYEHPGTWLPGDQIIDRDGGLCERGGDGKWRWYLHRDGRAYVEQRTDAGWTDEMVDSELALPGTRIVHLVPRPEPTPASSEDARRMLAARQEGAPVLPDTSGWVKREPGDVIEAGTPYVYVSPNTGMSIGKTLGETTVKHEVTSLDGDWWTPPPSAPSPVEAIPVGRNNAVEAWLTFDYGNTGERVLGLWWRGEDDDMSVWRSRDEKPWSARAVRKVEPLHVIPAELAEEIKAWAVGENVRGATKLVDAIAQVLS